MDKRHPAKRSFVRLAPPWTACLILPLALVLGRGGDDHAPAGSRTQGVPSLTPPELKPLLGPVILRGAGPAVPAIRVYDDRYRQNEKARFLDFLRVEDNPRGAYLDANHYGGLRSRLMWALRNSERWGPGVTDENLYGYARGVRIVRRYLVYAKKSKFNVQVQNNTGLADIELLYRLEGDSDALTHIHITAASYSRDQYNYVKVKNPHSGARIPAVALESFNAAYRLKIPYEPNPANMQIGVDPSISSWKEAGERLIRWLDEYEVVKPDGSIYTPSNKGDTYFMDAMIATQLLRWCGYVEWHPRAFELARLIMDHLITSVKPGWETLGYLDNSNGPAPDLAAYYVWPSLVLWQETHDPKYREFAISSIGATRKSYLAGMKQWNQVYSTLGQGAEALLSGTPWR
jgi:hypothetical protein